MLFCLKIKNFALIEELNIEFDDGLNVITGETGAGKSIIIEAINVILGSPANSNLIKSNKDYLEIEALFNIGIILKKQTKLLQKYKEIITDDQIIIRRQINRKKKNKCWINDHLTSLSTLQEIGNYLIDLHGQHSHQSLLSASSHIEFIDNLGGSIFFQKKNELFKCYSQWKAKKFLLNNLSKNRAENLSKKDFLLFQLQEIDDAKLIEKEDEELENKINIIHNTVKIKEIMEMAYLALYEGNEEGEASVRDTIVRLINNFNIITRLDIEIANIKNDLLEVQFKIEDIADKVIEYKEKLDFDAQQLQEFENRIDLINHLKKKYGSDIKEILEKRDFLQNQLDNIEDNQKKMEVLKNEIKEDEKNLTILSLYLSEQRKIIAEKLANDIIKELNELNMKNCSFDIKINQQEDSNGININNKLIKINSNGIDQVEFFIATNVGEQKKPLAEIVSGGEASRIMLGLKSILGKVDEVPTMIFDEIDSGVGARLGEIIATKLKKISRNHQIITVTHLPQIACRANRHLYINKYIDKTKTNIQLKILKGKEQLEEIARMIDGEQYGFISLEHAREMLYGKDFLKDEK